MIRHYSNTELALLELASYYFGSNVPKEVILWCAAEMDRTYDAIRMVLSQIKQKKVIGNNPSKNKNQIQRQLNAFRKVIGMSYQPIELPPSKKSSTHCIYCGKLPPVYHLKCENCWYVACPSCYGTLFTPSMSFTCQSCKDILAKEEKE
jgi:hypothetical protein